MCGTGVTAHLFPMVLALALYAECQGEVGMRGAPSVGVFPADLHMPRIF